MKTLSSFKYSGIIVFIVLFCSVLKAQPTQHETITVIGTYTPQLSEARKIGFTPEIFDTVIAVPKIEYRIVSVPQEIGFEVKPIPPAKMTGETFNKLYKNHLIAGMGNYWTPYIDFSHHSYRNKKLRGEIHLKHLSSGGKLTDYAHPGYSENKAGLSGHYLTENYTFSSGMDYIRNAVRFYGFMPDTLLPEFEKKDIQQVFNLLDFFLKGESNYLQKDRFHHSVGIKYQGLWDKFGVNEQNVYFNGGVKKYLSIASFLHDESIHVDLSGGFFSQKWKLQNTSTGLVAIKPYLRVKLDLLELLAGGNIAAQLDSVGEIHFFPYGRLDLHIVPGSLGIFLGIDGTLERNTFRNFSEINPFINTEIIPADFTKTKNILYGGVSGGFGGRFNYRLMAKNKQHENLPLFLNDTLPFMKDTSAIAFGNRFTTVYDNVDILTLSMELQLNFNRKFSVELNSAYNIFSPETQAKAWHLPQYEGNLKAVYNIDDKIYGKFNLFVYGSRYALQNNTEIKLDAVFDFNLEAEYRYSKNLGFWIRFNNFTTKRHFYWNNYPSQRLNMMLGASYTF